MNWKGRRYQLVSIISLCFFVMGNRVCGQDQSSPNTLFLLKEYLAAVKSYHPIAKQAGIGVEIAKAEVLGARSSFDPAIYSNLDRKTFKGTEYFDYFNTELKIPTWYGIEVKAGIEEVEGSFTANEKTKGQSSYLGISIPVGKNLLMDKRRAALQQAKIFRDQSVAEQRLMINDLLYESVAAYWAWWASYQIYFAANQAVSVNKERLELVKLGVRQGDRPAIDTIEALTQLQQFQYLANEAFLQYTNNGLYLSTFLWNNSGEAYTIPKNVIPDTTLYVGNLPVTLAPLPEWLALVPNQHPKLQMMQFKLDALTIERRLKFQSLLPTVNLNYNVLNSGYNVFKGWNQTLLQNNYKYGFTVGLPLRLSEGRAGYRQAKLKLQETGWQQSQLQIEILAKVNQYYNEWATLEQQVKLAEQTYLNYRTLFRGEDTRFKIGESSLFLLNARENKALEGLQKLIEARAKYYKAAFAVPWAAGQLQ